MLPVLQLTYSRDHWTPKNNGCLSFEWGNGNRISVFKAISKLQVSVTSGATWLISVRLHAPLSIEVAPEIAKNSAGTFFFPQISAALQSWSHNDFNSSIANYSVWTLECNCGQAIDIK